MSEGKHIPMRMCIGCRTMHRQDGLLRFVRDAFTGEVITDFQKTHFGRGAYICKNADCIKLAIKKRGLERHFKCRVDQEIYKAAEDLV